MLNKFSVECPDSNILELVEKLTDQKFADIQQCFDGTILIYVRNKLQKEALRILIKRIVDKRNKLV